MIRHLYFGESNISIVPGILLAEPLKIPRLYEQDFSELLFSMVLCRPRLQVVDLSVADDSQLVIVGDTHGQLEDVLWIFFKYGWPSEQNRYLFNGDIVDRSGAAQESSFSGGNW